MIPPTVSIVAESFRQIAPLALLLAVKLLTWLLFTSLVPVAELVESSAAGGMEMAPVPLSAMLHIGDSESADLIAR